MSDVFVAITDVSIFLLLDSEILIINESFDYMSQMSTFGRNAQRKLKQQTVLRTYFVLRVQIYYAFEVTKRSISKGTI